MAIQGDIRDFSLTQLFNLVHLARKTGLLTMQRTGETAKVYFREGKLACASLNDQTPRLPDLLLSNGLLTPRQYGVLCQNLNGDSDAAIGMRVVGVGMLNQTQILRCLESYHENNVRQLFGWSAGAFRFEADVPPPSGRIAVRVSLENLILDGVDRAKEIQNLQAEIPSLEMALQFRERPKDGLRGLHLSPTEWQVVQYVNPRNSLRQIGKALNLNEMEVRRAVYALVQSGVVEIVRPVEARPTPPPANTFAARDKSEQKSLLSRIIQRIRSI